MDQTCDLWVQAFMLLIEIPDLAQSDPADTVWSVQYLTYYQTTNFRLFQTERVC